MTAVKDKAKELLKNSEYLRGEPDVTVSDLCRV